MRRHLPGHGTRIRSPSPKAQGAAFYAGAVQPMRGADREEGLLDNQQSKRVGRKLTIFAIALASGVVRTVIAAVALVAAVVSLAIAGFLISPAFGFGALALGLAAIALMFGYGD